MPTFGAVGSCVVCLVGVTISDTNLPAPTPTPTPPAATASFGPSLLTLLAFDKTLLPSFKPLLIKPAASLTSYSTSSFLVLLPQFAAPTLRHLTYAPDAYALGHTEYLDFTL